jgi:lipopolysaccharide export system protein LptA
VKNSPYNIIKFIFFIFGLAGVLGMGPAPCPCFAADTDPPAAEEPNPIHITADRLITDNQAKWAEFIGNVKATQGDTVILSDRLKIFYKEIAEDQENVIEGEQSIEKIIAYGHVNIHFENKLAVSEQAVYITDKRILILTGPDSKVTSGDNYVVGNKITLYREDGHITVEGESEKRVEAVIIPGENGIE